MFSRERVSADSLLTITSALKMIQNMKLTKLPFFQCINLFINGVYKFSRRNRVIQNSLAMFESNASKGPF